MTRKVGYGDSTDPAAARAAAGPDAPAERGPRFPRGAVIAALAFAAGGAVCLFLALRALDDGTVERFALFAVLGIGLLVTGLSRLLKMALGLAPGGGPRGRR
ncbi:hypothetical protein GE300_01820 [Rhodobacteraceae bacterium 2CG4]|uniref:Uncharacterized protein n=1 Tax=Halovulum marinum TaxID=2662447 RepID=A0A6L5YVH8_9RHOB|nr:hypothetical protein [Halovulum marinum]MSU88353.1 hypothetical protein [Halovulum marinum]